MIKLYTIIETQIFYTKKKEYEMINRKSILTCIVILLIFFALSIVGRMDMESAQKNFLVYCDDIKEGIYPDFKNLSRKCQEFSR